MNKSDSEFIAGILSNEGYKKVYNIESADIVLVNTCSVREHAEQRVIGRIGELKKYKDKNPNLIIGICGCFAQRLQEALFDKLHHLDIVIGPDSYRKIPSIIKDVISTHSHCIDTEFNKNEVYSSITPIREEKIRALVTIMRGCNNFCSYCIVPFVRGRERSRPPQDIKSEIIQLANEGYKEVTLLGQNVNSYHYELEESKPFTLDMLLDELNNIQGIERIRFVTSHPRDMNDKILQAVARNNKVCEYLHLPIQSGSDKILKAMNRGYTRQYYIDLVAKAREIIPNVAITSDILVGFPTETDKDFEDTIDIIERVQFDSIFNFKYSPREGTASSEMIDDVPSNVKQKRLETVIALQQKITEKKNKELIGQKLEVLVEGKNKRGQERWDKGRKGQLMGRTRTDKVVFFEGDEKLIGNICFVKITNAGKTYLMGELVL